MPQKSPYGDFHFYIPPHRRYPDYRIRGPYEGFDPADYCQTLRDMVRAGALSWEHANALWREYADSVAMIYTDLPRPGPCVLSYTGSQVWWNKGSFGSPTLSYSIWGK